MPKPEIKDMLQGDEPYPLRTRSDDQPGAKAPIRHPWPLHLGEAHNRRSTDPYRHPFLNTDPQE